MHLAFPKTVNLLREFRVRWITRKFDHTSSVSALLHQIYLEPLEERGRISRLTRDLGVHVEFIEV